MKNQVFYSWRFNGGKLLIWMVTAKEFQTLTEDTIQLPEARAMDRSGKKNKGPS